MAAALELPKTHQNKAYKLRKRLRAMLGVLQHPHAQETSKLKIIAKLVSGALVREEDSAQEAMA